MGKKVPWKNKSPTGWWVATPIERFEFDGEDARNPCRRCRAWSNVILLKARDREHAYRKATRYGESDIRDSSWIAAISGRQGKLILEGLASLIPVYEEFDENGSEIFFNDYRKIAVRRVKRWVRQKADLEVFDDSQ